MCSSEARIQDSVLVVAHPDDEVLWFGSLLPCVDRVVMVYRDSPEDPEVGARRARAVRELPYAVTWLELPELGTLAYTGWEHAALGERGLDLGPGVPRSMAQAYERNHDLLLERLEPLLHGVATVFTHNPWGEYGHPDHAQLFHVAAALKREQHFALQVSPYVSRTTQSLAARYHVLRAEARESKKIDRRYVEEIADIYRSNDCWTWAHGWRWPENERLLEEPRLLSRGDPALSTPLVEVPTVSLTS